MSLTTQIYAPTEMARCPACRKALGDGNARTLIEVRILDATREPEDGAIVLECPRSRCRAKLQVRPLLRAAA